MPIPARAIPTPAPRRAQTPSHTHSATRPGSSIPRRGLHFIDHSDLYDLPLPSSAPVKGLSGVSMVKEKPTEKVREGRKSEVGIGELVLDGLGRREKRATTATSLGFDFIPNPSIMALPDTMPTASAVTVKHKLATSCTTPSPLAATPTTPALIPTQQDKDIDEDEDDDWDHITEFQDSKTVSAEGDSDDGDIIVLGDIELEGHEQDAAKGIKKMSVGGKREKTYAAVVGTA